MTNERVIWSQHGLYRFLDDTEALADVLLPANRADTADDMSMRLERRGFVLGWIDVEPVAVMMAYPEDCEPEEVIEWVTQER